MSEQDFVAEVKRILPSKLVENGEDDLGAFFLVLAVIYNDIKGYIYLMKYFAEENSPPKEQIVSAYLGEYNGMATQHFKILAGVVNEFFLFLKKHQSLYSSPKFRLLLLRLPKIVCDQWQDILDAAFERVINRDGLGYKLMLIRNNVAFHYDQSEKELVRSYEKFFSDKSSFATDFAYYSGGNTMQDTRFYYADAAVQQYMRNTSSKESDFVKNAGAYIAFQKETHELVQNMNIVLAHLLRQFIQMRLQAKK